MACPKGQYYCNTHKECRPIPDGCKVNKDGILVKEDLGKVVKGALTTAVQGGMSDLSRGALTSDRVKNTIKKHGKGALRSVVNSKSFKKFLEQAQKCHCEGCDKDPCVECGENCHDVSEAKIDDVKYGKGKGWNQPDKKRIDIYHARHSYLKKNPPNVRSDRNKRFNATDVVFHGHDKVERDRKAKHYASRGVKTRGIKKEIAGKDHSIDLKKEETVLEWGWKDHKKAIEQRKIRKGKAVPYDAMLVKKKSETVAASHELKGDNLQELDRMGGPAALAGIVGAGIGLAKSGIDAVSKTAKSLQKTTKQKNKQLKMLEEVEGGVSVETYTKGIQFTEIETVDIIEPTRLAPSPKAAEYYDWRVELDK